MTEETINKLKNITPVTEAGRQFLKLADDMRGAASLVESLMAASGDRPQDTTSSNRESREEAGIIIGAMMFNTLMSGISKDFNAMLDGLARKKGLERSKT